jgi:hypothetical protein
MRYNFPNIEYTGPHLIKHESGVHTLVISSAPRYYGKPGWTESCELLSATIGKNNEPLCLDKLIASGSLQGKFDHYGGDNSLWVFSLKFNTKTAFTKAEYLAAATEGKHKISKEVRLQFRIDISKQTSECDLCEPRHSVYEEFYYADIEFEHPILTHTYVQRPATAV